jgi:hypothetical protein
MGAADLTFDSHPSGSVKRIEDHSVSASSLAYKRDRRDDNFGDEASRFLRIGVIFHELHE